MPLERVAQGQQLPSIFLADWDFDDMVQNTCYSAIAAVDNLHSGARVAGETILTLKMEATCGEKICYQCVGTAG